MTIQDREFAKNRIEYLLKISNFALDKHDKEALELAIKALENIGHLKDRPCSVCEFNKENGCCKWTCVFTDRLFGDMR